MSRAGFNERDYEAVKEINKVYGCAVQVTIGVSAAALVALRLLKKPK